MADWILVAQAAAGGAEGFNPLQFLPFVLVAVAFYFMVLLPQQRERKSLETKLKEIKKNDVVLTSGGVLATVVQAGSESKYLTVRIDDNNGTKMTILRSAIVHVGDPEKDETKEPKKD